MGICVLKNEQNLDQFCQRQPQFQVDLHKTTQKCFRIWKMTPTSCQPLKWPYKFTSTCSYIILIASGPNSTSPILHQDRTSIQLAEMLFGAQFLCTHLKINKKLMLSNREYQLTVYSFYGDSEDSQCLARARLTYYMVKLENMLEFAAGSVCLAMLNQGQPVVVKDQLKQFIDFESQQYEQARTHTFFNQQLLPTPKTLKQSLSVPTCSQFFQNFSHNAYTLKHIQIDQKQNLPQQSKKPNKQSQQDLPFACQITQINTRPVKKVMKFQSGHIDQSNILFDQLGIQREFQESQKKEEFVKGLFLATEKVSRNYNLLSHNQIKLIVNCAASTCKNWFINDISYKWIDMPDPCLQSKDAKDFNIQCLIYQTADLVTKVLSQSAGVLIHCTGYNSKVEFSGSRSACIMIGVIMCSFKIGYDEAYEMVNKKWKIQLPQFMTLQLKQIQSRMQNKPKGFQIHSICSYSKNFPKHLVAKYICEVENINNIQGIDNFTKSVFLCVGVDQAKIMVGRQCEFKEEYEKYAKDHLRLIGKYQGWNGQCSVELIDKTFRKQPRIVINQQILNMELKGKNKNAGFQRNEELVLKYPILRPVWQKKKQDCFYFTIREKQHGAEVIMNKGMNWIGYEQDKEQFFDKIINCYLSHIPHDKIFILESEAEKSLFDESELNI